MRFQPDLAALARQLLFGSTYMSDKSFGFARYLESDAGMHGCHDEQ